MLVTLSGELMGSTTAEGRKESHSPLLSQLCHLVSLSAVKGLQKIKMKKS